MRVPVVMLPRKESGFLLGANPTSVQRYCVIVTWMNVCVVIWRDQTRVEDVRLVSDTLQRLAEEHRDGVGLIQYIDDRSESLSLTQEARTALAELLRRGRPYIRCSSLVFTGEGFRASAVRAIVTGIAWLARPGFPHQVFAKTADAAAVQASHFVPAGSQKSWASLLEEIVHKARDLTPSAEIPKPSSPLRARSSLGAP
jgi:hypothetical protein